MVLEQQLSKEQRVYKPSKVGNNSQRNFSRSNSLQLRKLTSQLFYIYEKVNHTFNFSYILSHYN